jgi:hypothetical protein
MKSRLILLLLAAHAGAALAQYKCTGANGAVTFQQTPCFGAKAEEKLVVSPNGHPSPSAAAGAGGSTKPASGRAANGGPAAAGADGGVNKRMLAGYERQHQREALERELEAAENDKDQRSEQRSQAVEAVEKQFGDRPDNAAALRDALAAIDSRYRALGAIDDRRIRSARSALGDWEATQAKAAAEAAAASRK